MKLFMLIVNILSSIPAPQSAPPQKAPAQGYGEILVAGCDPGETVVVAGVAASADSQGVARLRVPAGGPYSVDTMRGSALVHGDLARKEVLSAVCR